MNIGDLRFNCRKCREFHCNIYKHKCCNCGAEYCTKCSKPLLRYYKECKNEDHIYHIDINAKDRNITKCTKCDIVKLHNKVINCEILKSVKKLSILYEDEKKNEKEIQWMIKDIINYNNTKII